MILKGNYFTTNLSVLAETYIVYTLCCYILSMSAAPEVHQYFESRFADLVTDLVSLLSPVNYTSVPIAIQILAQKNLATLCRTDIISDLSPDDAKIIKRSLGLDRYSIEIGSFAFDFDILKTFNCLYRIPNGSFHAYESCECHAIPPVVPITIILCITSQYIILGNSGLKLFKGLWLCFKSCCCIFGYYDDWTF